MPYTPTTWSNDNPPPISAANLNKIETGIDDAHDLVATAQADIDAHEADTVDAHDASAISFTPAGTIAATNVQAAIEEVATEAGGGGGGGGGLGYSAYHPDAPPLAAHAADDEFSDSSLNAKWTEWDPGNHVTVTESDEGLELANNSNGSRWGGIYQPMISGDFTAHAKVSVPQVDSAGVSGAGILLTQDLAAAPATADLHAFNLQVRPAGIYAVGWGAYSDYATYGGTEARRDFTAPFTTIYLRLRYVAATLVATHDYSIDGMRFRTVNTRTLPFTPVHIALAFSTQETGTPSALFHFFRVVPGTSRDVALRGQRIS